jgi:hypothetical protein
MKEMALRRIAMLMIAAFENTLSRMVHLEDVSGPEGSHHEAVVEVVETEGG